MAIQYRTTKFKCTNILAIAIWGSTANFNYTTNISSYTVILNFIILFYYQINHTDSISGSEQIAMETRALQHRKRHNRMRERPAE